MAGRRFHGAHGVHRRHHGRIRVPSPSWPAAQCRRAPEGHRRHHGRLTPSWRPGGHQRQVGSTFIFSTLSASGFPGTLSEMNASRRKTCSNDTCTNFSTADPVPAESSTSLDEIQQNFLVASNSLGMYPVYWDRDRCDIMSTNCCLKAIRSQITSQFGPRDRCYIMSTNCCSVESDKIQIRSLFGPRDRGVRRAQHQIGCNAR